MKTRAVYTEKNNCQDCYKCIRECPVKAIKIQDNSASIVAELCVYCGHCVETCPVEAKRVRSDVELVRHYLESNQRVVAAVAPSYVAEYGMKQSEIFKNSLINAGFDDVVEVAEGAGILSNRIADYIKDNPDNIHLSSCCPSVVMLIRKYYPHLSKYLLPFYSPMLIEGQLIKEKNDNTRVVFIGPCIAKKEEAELFPGNIDLVLTYKEVNELLQVLEDPDNLFVNNNNGNHDFSGGMNYPLPGGMIVGLEERIGENVEYIAIDGMDKVGEFLESFEAMSFDKPIFIELTSCEGSCINGPGSIKNNSVVKRELEMKKYLKSILKTEHAEITNTLDNINTDYSFIKPVTQVVPEEEEIESMLNSIGKRSEKDRLNCGSCGYDSCYRFAIANIRGKAERRMCVSYMRKVAHNKATVLLRKMPYGVIMVDENLNIIESNENFASLLGEEVEEIFEVAPGLEGISLKKLGEFYNYFRQCFLSDSEYLEKEIRINNKLVKLSIFTIQKQKILCGIFNNLTIPQIQKEEIVKRTKQVIEEYLGTVQQVAFMLGENASKTEASLNKIVEVYNPE